MASLPLATTAAACLLVAGLGQAPGPPMPGADPVAAEYYDRLAETPPRDGDAHYELGRWCLGRGGLEEEAQRSFEKAVSIDPDHALARTALGFERHGLGWRRHRELDAAPAELPSQPESAPTAAPAPARLRPHPLPAEPVAPPAALGRDGWSARAAAVLPETLNVIEDRDTIVETTYPASSPGVTRLRTRLLEVSGWLRATLRMDAQAPLLHPKLHIFLLEAEPARRLVASLTGKPFPAERGSLALDEHTVVFSTSDDDASLGGAMARAALRPLAGSPSGVSWWLRDGLAELAGGGLAERTAAARCHEVAAEAIRASGSLPLLDEVLRTPAPRERDEGAALAASVLDYVLTTRPDGLARFVAALRERSGPSLPADSSSATFRRAFLDYLDLQERLLRSELGLDRERLERAWREYVLARAPRRFR